MEYPDVDPSETTITESTKIIDAYQKATDDARDELAGFMLTNSTPPSVSAREEPNSAGLPSQSREKPPNKMLMPSTLSKEDSPAKLRICERDFQTFIEGGSHLPVASQQAYFFRCIEDKLRLSIEHRIGPETPIQGRGGCLDILRGEFAIIHPIFTRQVELFRTKTSEGEDAVSFLDRLSSLALEANASQMDADSITLFLFINGCQDDKLREKLLEKKKKTMPEVRAIASEYVAQQRAQEAINTKAKQVVAAVSKNSKKPRIRTFKPRSMADMKGRCFQCGELRHRNPKQECRVVLEDLSCKGCTKQGHLQNVCLKALFPNVSSKSVRAVVEECTDEEVMPKLPVKVSHNNGSFNASALADTGSAVTMMSSKLAAKNHVHIKQDNSPINYVNINGDPIPTKGLANITLSTTKRSAATEAIVASTMDDLLIGCKDLKRLQVIPMTFPINAVNAGNSFQQLKTKIIMEFPKVLSDSLSETSMIGGIPMKIYTKSGEIKPYKVTTARKIPYHWREKAERAIAKLLDSKRIVPPMEPTEWCVPAFFVIKEDGELRLVIDYTFLNKAVERPTHMFPSSAEIVSGIDPESRFFAKLDATAEYHQIQLDEKTSKMATFLLPSGRYRPLTAPMGLSCSSDEFCRRSDEVMVGLPGCRKLVDDILVQAPTIDILLNRIRALLKRCKEKGPTLSRKKFEMGECVSFAGFTISHRGIFPQKSKLEAIEKFPAPENLSQSRSFFGMINQLNSFYPDLTNIASPLHSLLKGKVAYTWLTEHNEAFMKVKEYLSLSDNQ